MLFSKDDSKNLANLVQNTSRIVNALEQLTETILKNSGRDFIPNKEEALKNAKMIMHSTDLEQIADDEYVQERNRIIKSLKDKELLENVPFFEEDSLSIEELEYIQE